MHMHTCNPVNNFPMQPQTAKEHNPVARLQYYIRVETTTRLHSQTGSTTKPQHYDPAEEKTGNRLGYAHVYVYVSYRDQQLVDE